MAKIIPYFKPKQKPFSHVAIFISGSGTNAEKILDYWCNYDTDCYDIKLIFTDRPNTSNAKKLSVKFNIRLIENDIKAYYTKQGCNRVTIGTPEGKKIREEWTNGIREQLKPFAIDFALFAGFIPLTNLTADFPCLNVHPGDLTYLKNSKRHLIGLHTIPIERAILEGLKYLRSSVIIAMPYFESEDAMDNGPILGVSEKVTIDFMGKELSELKKVYKNRPTVRPKGGYQDSLEQIAVVNQESLKINGDWIVFPHVVSDFAKGKYGHDEKENQYYKNNLDEWIKISTVEYGLNHKHLIR